MVPNDSTVPPGAAGLWRGVNDSARKRVTIRSRQGTLVGGDPPRDQRVRNVFDLFDRMQITVFVQCVFVFVVVLKGCVL